MIFFIFALIRSVAKGDDGGSFSGALHGNAIADRGTVFARATRLWLSVALVPFFFILAQLFLVLVAGKTFYNFIAAHPVESQIPFEQKLIGSLPLANALALPVYVARAPPAPLSIFVAPNF